MNRGDGDKNTSKTAYQDPWNYMLDYAIPREKWHPNSNTCVHCSRPFDLINRQHHCRRCGECVCSRCSPNNMTMASGWGGSERVCIKCETCVLKVRNFIQQNARQLQVNHDGLTMSERFTFVDQDGSRHMTCLWLSESFFMMCYRDRNDRLRTIFVSDISHVEEGFSTPELIKLSTPGLLACCLGDEKAEALKRAEKKLFSLVTKTGVVYSFISSSEKQKNDWVNLWKLAITSLQEVLQYHIQNIPLTFKKLHDMEIDRMKKYPKTSEGKGRKFGPEDDEQSGEVSTISSTSRLKRLNRRNEDSSTRPLLME